MFYKYLVSFLCKFGPAEEREWAKFDAEKKGREGGKFWPLLWRLLVDKSWYVWRNGLKCAG